MERKQVPYNHKLNRTLSTLADPGLLLVGTKSTGQSNVMTISWGMVGRIWDRPMFLVLVRPSRYTYEFIEESKAFTVNVPSEEMRAWVEFCGSHSGRDVDKFGLYNRQVTSCKTICAATIDDCPMVYECRVVHHNDVIPAHLDPEIEKAAYGGRNYHRLYFGEILAAYASPDY